MTVNSNRPSSDSIPRLLTGFTPNRFPQLSCSLLSGQGGGRADILQDRARSYKEPFTISNHQVHEDDRSHQQSVRLIASTW